MVGMPKVTYAKDWFSRALTGFGHVTPRQSQLWLEAYRVYVQILCNVLAKQAYLKETTSMPRCVSEECFLLPASAYGYDCRDRLSCHPGNRLGHGQVEQGY
jgi:hypothetical protein